MSSCATIFTGTRDMISFKSNVAGTRVMKDNVELCETPCSAKIKRELSGEPRITFIAKGYEEKTIELEKRFNGVSVLSIVLGILPVVVDVATGSIWHYRPKDYNVSLKPLEESNKK